METVTIHKAKTELSRLIKKACRGEEIVIARGKTPVAKLVPLHKTTQKRVPGLWKGLVTYTPDAFDPLTDQELKDLGFE
ncbi:MAG TPA: type II toxin-antitoxin system prevent-host-death family antitoxin [Terriglobales bacterium]|jgi:prevent-host-death family protein|nr:type II toxin-antitoxin system prevent-host-death family antitoxin [Terriglobales bacterium]